MRHEPSSLNVLIIGCGNIAGGFDAQREPGAAPLTHAGALTAVPGFTLAACVDPDQARLRSFQDRWRVAAGFSDVSELAGRGGAFDVISICSPTAMHAAHLAFALEMRPRLVFCEKPVTPSLAETAAWVERFESADILLAVNHTRRWAPDVARLRDELTRGDWGEIRSAVGFYGKGVLNNGSHMVDLLAFLLGPLCVASAGAGVSDFWETDPTIPATLMTPKGVPVHLATSHAQDYALFELQLITERGVIAMEDGGLRWRIRRTRRSPHFAGYQALDDGIAVAGEYWHAMTTAVRNVQDAVRSGVPLASTGRTAMQAQAVCEQIRLAASDAGYSTAPTAAFPARSTNR